MPKANKEAELIGYAKIQIEEELDPQTAKILSDGTCWLNDGRVLNLPQEELARLIRQMEYKNRDDRLTNKSINIMSTPSLDEKPYKDEEDLIKEKKQAQLQRQAAIAKEKERRAQMEQEKIEQEKKKHKTRLFIICIVLAIAAAGFFLSMNMSSLDGGNQDATSIVQQDDAVEQ